MSGNGGHWQLLAEITHPVQSALHPRGPAASEIAVLWWVMLAVFTGVFLLVMGLLVVALLLRRDRESTPPLGKNGFVIAGGVVLPIVVLLPLFIYSLETSHNLRQPETEHNVEVIGHQWWWEVRYPGTNIVTANEIHIPAGQPVSFKLASADVIHSFWVPSLQGKRDMIPGQLTTFWLQADEPGQYRGQCGEYCGVQHARMALIVVALPPEEYEQWLLQQQAPRSSPSNEVLSRGAEVFQQAGCAKCHTIRDTPAQGAKGPDLTHIGSRQSLGAGTLPNNYGSLAGWIGNPQALKPGIEMPATYLPAADLHALVSYLESLQ